MKRPLSNLAIATFAIATVTSPALAGAPDNPGGLGQAAAVAQPQEVGEFFSVLAPADGGVVGDVVQFILAVTGGAPNTSNDEGGGNDP